jgi:MFS family permease
MRIKLLLPPAQLAWLCLVALCWGFGFGLGAPLASLWLRDAGFSEALIGWNTSVYYLGIALAAAAIPWMMRRWGKTCPLAGIAISALTVSLFPWGGDLPGWFAIRLVNGLGAAMALIPIETYVNQQAAPRERARNFGFYAFAIALGIALGTFAGMQLYSAHAYFAFLLGGGVTLVGAAILHVAMLWPDMQQDELDRTEPVNLRSNVLCFGSGWVQGFLEGIMIAHLSIYLLTIGFTDDGASWLMSSLMMGVILAQVPVAWLADRLGRKAVILGCYAVAVVGMMVLPGQREAVPLAGWLFLVAAASAALYPLGLALLGQRTPAPALARANAWFLGINCLGSIIGPIAAGKAMDRFGGPALFYVSEGAILCVLAVSVGARYLGRRTLQPQGLILDAGTEAPVNRAA